MRKFAIILSGCGVYDGSEIHEAVATMWAVQSAGHSCHFFAPDIEQHHVINHFTKKVSDENRNVLVEAARIARGEIDNTKKLSPEDFDALLLPGGFGVAKNLSNYAFSKSDFSILPEIETIIKAFHHQQKPIGALCISPVLLAKCFAGAILTVGNERETIDRLKTFNIHHQESKNREVVIDRENKLATTPCYMLDASIVDIFQSAKNLISTIETLFN